MPDIDNPYWEEVKDHIAKSPLFRWEGPQVRRWSLDGGKFEWEQYPDREELVCRYSWTIPDPLSLQFVANYIVGGVVDPLAGSGYWGYLLGQLNIPVVNYDLHTNGVSEDWHGKAKSWMEITPMDGAEAVALHPDKTLLLAWPPYSDDLGARVLKAYRGDRVIYIGEYDGCCGDEAMHNELYTWKEIDEHIPVQWEGLHDRITVYERNAEARELAVGEAEMRTGEERIAELLGDHQHSDALVPAMQGGV